MRRVYIIHRDYYSNASAEKTTFSSAREVRELQKRYPYNERNKKKPWWKCACGNESVGGCVRGKVCIGPGGISYAF